MKGKFLLRNTRWQRESPYTFFLLIIPGFFRTTVSGRYGVTVFTRISAHAQKSNPSFRLVREISTSSKLSTHVTHDMRSFILMLFKLLLFFSNRISQMVISLLYKWRSEEKLKRGLNSKSLANNFYYQSFAPRIFAASVVVNCYVINGYLVIWLT